MDFRPFVETLARVYGTELIVKVWGSANIVVDL
jgi:hypothetical protein